MNRIRKVCLGIGIFVLVASRCIAEEWIATAYCSCIKCCGKNDNITASGEPAKAGTVAVNWLPFGSTITINGKKYTVKDRGAKSLFGSAYNHKKRVDIWMPSHKQALEYGKRRVDVEI